MKRFLAAMTASVLAVSAMPAVAFADTPDVFIVGDSTACEYGVDENYAIPRAGWGMYIGNFLDGVKVTDLAMSGRSSKSFTTEENYYTFKTSVGEGDYVLIQFGHNDAKNTKEEDKQLRYTDPEGDKDTEGSFKHSLYANYIQPTLEAGATPVLLTPISRRGIDGNGKTKDSHGLYDDAVRDLAKETGVVCIDMTQATSDLYDSVGNDGSMYYHAVYNDRAKGKDGIDNTHLNHWGGEQIAYITAQKLGEAGVLKTKGSIDDTALTRGEFTKGLVRAMQLEAKDNMSNFADVNKDKDYYEAVAIAKAYGIVVGDENAVFNGDRKITAAELATMVERALSANGAEIPETRGETFAARAAASAQNIKNMGVEVDVNSALTKQDCYEAYTDSYNAVTKLKALQADTEQSLDEIEKTETVIVNK